MDKIQLQSYKPQQPKNNTYTAKLKYIVPTFSIIVFSTVFGLAFLRWLLCLQFSVLDIKEEIWTLWIPPIFSSIPIAIWLRPRFRVLTVNKIGLSIILFISWAAVTTTVIYSQLYIGEATSRLQTLSTIDDIDKHEKSRYYKSTNFAVARIYRGYYGEYGISTSSSSGSGGVGPIKGSSSSMSVATHFTIFFVIPIKKDTNERITSAPKHWYGLVFYKTINGRISDKEIEKKYNEFVDECNEDIDKYDFNSLEYFERITQPDIRIKFLKAIEFRTKKPTDESIVVLNPIQKKEIESRKVQKLGVFFVSLLFSFGIFLYALVFPGYRKIEDK